MHRRAFVGIEINAAMPVAGNAEGEPAAGSGLGITEEVFAGSEQGIEGAADG